MKSFKKLFLASVVAVTFTAGVSTAVAETVGEKVSDGVETVKDESCKMVNGKMECAAKKMKRKVKKGVDKVKEEAHDATH